MKDTVLNTLKNGRRLIGDGQAGLYLASRLRSLKDLIRTRESGHPARLLWKQLIYQNFDRSPAVLRRNFQKTLRVCVTYRCNLSCRHCYAKGLSQNSEDMSIDEFDRLAEWAVKMGWKTLRFIGGEPTVHPRFGDILRRCFQNRTRVNMSTNNVFSPEILPLLRDPLFEEVSVHYNSPEFLGRDNTARFYENLDYFLKNRIRFGFSFPLDGQRSGLEGLVRDLDKYRPAYLRVNLPLPGLYRDSTKELFESAESVYEEILTLRKKCLPFKVPFFMYHPVPECLFSPEQWQELKAFSSFFVFHRCPLGIKNDYGIMVTVNPDLSFFPCPVLSMKRENILSFNSRRQISECFREELIENMLRPLKDDCRKCEAGKKFVAGVSGGLSERQFFRNGGCQGGCLRFRWEERKYCYPE